MLSRRRRHGLLGQNIAGSEGFDFDIRIQMGAGAYVCGEESALIESLEGKRGAPRDRPPYPVQRGYKLEPTSVNNVETLCCAARIMEKGADWFVKHGTRDSTGTKLLSVSGDCERPGVYEVEYGITVDKLLELVGAEDAQAVQVGGPSGSCLAPQGLRAQDLLRRPPHRRLDHRVRAQARPAEARAGLHRVLRGGVLRLVRPLPGGHHPAEDEAGEDPGRAGARPPTWRS